jgi:hypothetical protein
MDVAVLRSRIIATLDPGPDVRRRAELDLKAVRRSSSAVVNPANTAIQG